MVRRSVLAMALGAGGAAGALTLKRGARGPLRAPGAADERRFAGLCIRCGNCVDVCPAKIIRPELGASGVAAFLTPALHFEARAPIMAFQPNGSAWERGRCGHQRTSAIGRQPMTEDTVGMGGILRKMRADGDGDLLRETAALAVWLRM